MCWSLVLRLLHNVVLSGLPELLDKVTPRKLFGFPFLLIYEMRKLSPQSGIWVVTGLKNLVN